MPVDLWSLPAELADEVRLVDSFYKQQTSQDRDAAERRERAAKRRGR